MDYAFQYRAVASGSLILTLIAYRRCNRAGGPLLDIIKNICDRVVIITGDGTLGAAYRAYRAVIIGEQGYVQSV